MKYVIPMLIGLILISGCAEEIKETKMLTFTIPEEEKAEFKTYSIEGEESDDAFFYKSWDKRNELNKRYYYDNLEDENQDRLIDERTRNWRRVLDNEMIVGYDDEEDESFYKFDPVND
ncbi:hypothetical protein ISS05_02320 [Candidatus Woesearchaeota archaeon]|nr:hypothetical protein [Candidatus Woesearchaeota archaeon]